MMPARGYRMYSGPRSHSSDYGVAMSDNVGTAQGPVRKPGDWSEQIPHCGAPGISRPNSAIGTKLFMTKCVRAT
jgi:hypothetical protein